MAFPPVAPEAVVGAVSAGQVRLTWRLPDYSPVATGYLIEAGTAPGSSNLGTFRLGPANSLTVPGVPAGRYFVQVRAINFAGTGAASSEAVVDVP